ncbi:glycosyl hydrolase family 28-related protein [Sphingomonas nostoxanthinifaciens]|uniref:glycosyl hydrolase family 28-related protein n=1 Tax=Sphingomonas nostoxanthinifaciens TaxID=2872652 RepID=UPI001CC1E9D4|nr:glycosyl hydrolase family 28-related protein [Sphingomonas nostoxanthinifaciens]
MAAPNRPMMPLNLLSAPLDDPRAVTVQAPADGRTDATAAIQQALDAAAAKGEGIVFLPAGRYRISRSLHLWPGVRLFGAGATRPVLVLADNTPGFQQGVATMVVFVGSGRATDPDAHRPGRRVPFPPRDNVPFDPAIADANPGTFYSGMANVDIEIGAGNAAAVGVRFHAAQHAYLHHMDFHVGSGLAGIYQVANEAEDLHFHGGRYGILTEKPSPAWQFTLIDSSFDGQREAAIREHEASLTLVNVGFRDVPVGIDIDQGYGDWLWGKDVRFENVARAGVVISNEDNAYTQIGFENALATGMPTFARFRDSGKTIAGAGPSYRVKDFSYGLTLPGLGAPGTYQTNIDAAGIAAMPAPAARAIRPLPPSREWVSVRTLGAKGDNTADDTAALQHAIDTHRVLYFPAGRYVVTDTLKLRPDSVLIGLHPDMTQIVLPDGTPAFQGIGAPRALIATAKGGAAIVSGLGLFTGGINPRATALLWKAGAESLLEDVKFQGGHGTALADGTRFDPYNDTHSADQDQRKRWSGQYPSLWVTDGGGGTFSNLWTPDTYAQTGFRVSDTTTPGHVYEVSSEHHVVTEFGLERIANWEFLSPQTEEESGESQDTVSFDIRDAKNLLIANLHAYRVTRTVKPALTAVRLQGDNQIRFRNVHVNAESGLATCDENGCATELRASKFPFENAILDVTKQAEVREREFAVLDLPGATPPAAPDARVRKLADGFYSASGGAVDAKGKLYFVDHRFQRIHGWSEAEGLTVERDDPLDPVNLAIDRSGDIIVLSSYGREGTVYSFKPGTSAEKLTVIAPTPVAAHSSARTLLPGNLWNNGEFRDQLDFATYRFTTLAEMFARDMGQAKTREYVSPDGSLVLPAFRAFEQGPSDHLGWRFSDSLSSYGFVSAKPGERVFLSNGSENKTYSGLVGAGGAVTDLKPFANRGGESVAVGSDGRVYVANGQVFVYAPDGSQVDRIDVPERPLQLLFGGTDGRMLYILTHHALYAARL